MKWLRELKKDDVVVKVTFEKDGAEVEREVRVDYVSSDKDEGFFGVYAGGHLFNQAGICHGPDNTYSVIKEKAK